MSNVVLDDIYTDEQKSISPQVISNGGLNTGQNSSFRNRGTVKDSGNKEERRVPLN